jgi:aldehyde dehydrogenase (NAD+)
MQREAHPVPPSPAAYRDLNRLFIDGAWRPGGSGRVAVDRDPYTGRALTEITLADAHDVDEAYRAAERAQPGWSAVPPEDRRAVLERAAHLVENRRAEIIDWLVHESGSVRAKAQLEWQFAHQGLFEATSYPFHIEGRILPSSIPGKESRVYRSAVGVVGVISPWNFPFHLTMRSVAPAIAAGNAIVIKPASDTPVTGGLLFAKIFEEAGLPPGVLNVIVGAGSEIGDAMVDHPIPRIITFTGSTEVGRHIAERAGRAIKRVCLELGGNTPFIVFADADLDRAVDAAVAGKFLHQGQICIAINRILVESSIHDEFVNRFLQRTALLHVGDPEIAETAIGPIINQQQLTSIVRKVDDTVARGARVVLPGKPDGLVLPPIVLDDVTNDMPAAHEELFGPVAPILRFSGEDEAVRIANDTEYGLSSAVFSRDLETAHRVARRLQVGMTHINDWPVNDEANTAFGGEKASGLGRFGGEWAIEEFTTDHWISEQHAPRRYPI